MKKLTQKTINFLIPSLVFCGTLFILGSLVGSQPIGHDEAVYLTKARSWMEGTPADEFEIYRPIGMAWFGWLFLHFGDSEIMMRSFGVIFGAISTLFIYLFFRRISNLPIAVSITGIVITSTLFLKEAPLFQNDIPSSGLLFGVLWLVYIYYKTASKSKSIYFAGPLAALAFYLRYGVASSFGIIAVLSILILGHRLIKKKDANYLNLVITVIISVLLFAPHFIQSFIVERKIFGILSRAGEAAHRAYLGEGLVNYIKWLPNEIGGWFLGITAIIGIVATIVIVFRKKLRQNYVGMLWIGSIGLSNFIITGLLVHAESRYVFFPVVLLSGVGIASIYYMISHWSKISANLLVGVFLLSIIYSGIISYNETNSFFRTKEADPYGVAYIEISEAIRKDSATENGCAIWAITTNRPKISWYSKCNTLQIRDMDLFEKDFYINFRKAHYSIVRDTLKKEKQIDQKEAENFGVNLTEIFGTKNLSKIYGGNFIVYRITRKYSEEEDFLNLLEK